MAYSAAKAALINLTLTLAKEVAPDILVNAVAPGFVHTPYFDAVPEEMTDRFMGATPLKRFLATDEIAEVDNAPEL